MGKSQKSAMGTGAETVQPFENTPIYRKAEEVLRGAHSTQSKMAKTHKYTTGSVMCDRCLELSEAVAWAYIENDDIHRKLELVEKVEARCMSVLILHRVARSLNLIERSMYVEQVDKIVSIIKQARGWRTHIKETIANPAKVTDGRDRARAQQSN